MIIKQFRFWFFVALPLLLGGLIYILFRAESLKMFTWFEAMGLSDFIKNIRKARVFSVPEWVIFSLPDALWLFSFSNIMLILWGYKLSKQSIIWIFAAPIIGLISEFGQAVSVVPGTFDLLDLIFLFFASILPFIIFNKTINYEKF